MQYKQYISRCCSRRTVAGELSANTYNTDTYHAFNTKNYIPILADTYNTYDTCNTIKIYDTYQYRKTGTNLILPNWHKLVRASVLDCRPAVDGFFRVRNQHKVVEGAAATLPSELAVFACDFTRLNPTVDLPGPCCCSGAFARRPRPACGRH